MSAWTFQINAGGGWIDLTDYNGRSLIPREGISLQRDSHNKGKSTIDTLSFRIVGADQSLIQLLYNQKTYEPIEIVVDRDGFRYFTGYLRPVDEISTTAESVAETEISLEAVDVLWKLQRKLDSKLNKDGDSVDSIVRSLLSRGGFSSGDMIFPVTLTQSVSVFQEDADDREILQIIDTLLFEYHSCLIATASGEIDIFDWLDDGSTPVGTFDEFIDSVNARKTDDDYGYIEVSHYRTASVGNDSGTGLETLHTSYHYQTGQGLMGTSPQSFELRLDLEDLLPDGADVLSVSDLQVQFSWQNTSVDGTAIYTSRGSSTGFRNVGSTINGIERKLRYGDGVRLNMSSSRDGDDAVNLMVDFHDEFIQELGKRNEFTTGQSFRIANVTIQVRGKVEYRTRTDVIRETVSDAGSANARAERYDAEYIYTTSGGQSLASAILQLRQYGSKKWTVRSSSELAVGDVVEISPGPYGLSVRSRIQRVVDSQDNATDYGLQEYVYTVESLESASSSSSSPSTGIPSIPAFRPSPASLDDRPTFQDIIDGVTDGGKLDELPPPALSVAATVRKVSLSVGYADGIVSGSLRVELQISNDDTNWFSLGPGGNNDSDWKDTADEVTRIVGSSYTHDNLPLNGDAADPLQTTYYYRARMAAGALTSAWSDSVSVVVSPVLEGDIGANSVTANKINAGAVTANKIDAGAVTADKIGVGAVTADKIDAGAVTADKIDVADLSALGANIGGWDILSTRIQSTDVTVLIDSNERRFEVRDAFDTPKIALGYLGNIPGFTSDEFGLFVGDGNTVSFTSGATFDEGSYFINADAAFVAESGAREAVRLGSLGSGEIGLDIGSMRFGETLGGGSATGTFGDTLGGGGAAGAFDETFGGGDAEFGNDKGLLYTMSDNVLKFQGELRAATGTFSGDLIAAGGTFRGELQAAGGTFAGSLQAATGDFSGQLRARTILVGSGVFNSDPFYAYTIRFPVA